MRRFDVNLDSVSRKCQCFVVVVVVLSTPKIYESVVLGKHELPLASIFLNISVRRNL